MSLFHLTHPNFVSLLWRLILRHLIVLLSPSDLLYALRERNQCLHSSIANLTFVFHQSLHIITPFLPTLLFHHPDLLCALHWRHWSAWWMTRPCLCTRLALPTLVALLYFLLLPISIIFFLSSCSHRSPLRASSATSTWWTACRCRCSRRMPSAAWSSRPSAVPLTWAASKTPPPPSPSPACSHGRSTGGHSLGVVALPTMRVEGPWFGQNRIQEGTTFYTFTKRFLKTYSAYWIIDFFCNLSFNSLLVQWIPFYMSASCINIFPVFSGSGMTGESLCLYPDTFDINWNNHRLTSGMYPYLSNYSFNKTVR